MDKDGLPDIGRCWKDGKISATLMNPALNSGRDGLERDSSEETGDILVLAPLRAVLPDADDQRNRTTEYLEKAKYLEVRLKRAQNRIVGIPQLVNLCFGNSDPHNLPDDTNINFEELETRFKDATKKEDIRTVLKDIFSRITMPEGVLIKDTSKKDVLCSRSAKIDFAVLNSTESLWAYTVAVVQVEFEISGSQYIDALGKIMDSFSKVLSEQPARDILYGLIISRFDF